MKIRKSSKKDERKVKELISNALEEIFGVKPIKIELKYDTFYIAEEKGKTIGTIALNRKYSHQARLGRMYVDKKYRKNKVAQKLFDKIIDYCKKNKIKKIYLTTYPKMCEARKFYKKQGFKQAEKKFKDGRKQFVLNLK